MKPLEEYLEREQIKNLAEVISPFFESSVACNPLAVQKKKDILEEYGSIDLFLNKSQFKIISGPNDSNLAEFYDLYSSIFVVPEEKESLDGFRDILALKNRKDLQEKFGKFSNTMIYLKDPMSKDLMGGINFSNYVMPENIQKTTGINGTNQIVYIFVHPDYRKVKIGQALYNVMDSFSQNFISGVSEHDSFDMALKNNVKPAQMYFFAEQEAPELLIANQGKNWFEKNPQLAVEQMKRLSWWDRMGFMRVMFPYVQPALRDGDMPCNILSFNVKDHGENKIYANVLTEHLDRFFHIDVFKGKNKPDEVYSKQMKHLALNGSTVQAIPLRDHYKIVQENMSNKIFYDKY